MKFAIFLAGWLTMAVPASAQQSAAPTETGTSAFPPNARGMPGIVLPPVDAEKRSLAKALIRLVGVPSQMSVYMEAAAPAFDPTTFATAARSDPRLAARLVSDPQYVKRQIMVQQIARPKFDTLKAQEAGRFESVLENYYGAKLSAEEMRASIQFFRSPAGQHYVALMRSANSDIFPMMLPIIREMEPQISAVYDKAVTAAETKYPTPPGVSP